MLRGAPTPRIDNLASEGMRLLNFNVEAQCTPSRAALMTARYAFRTGNGSVPIIDSFVWSRAAGSDDGGDALRSGLRDRHVR